MARPIPTGELAIRVVRAVGETVRKAQNYLAINKGKPDDDEGDGTTVIYDSHPDGADVDIVFVDWFGKDCLSTWTLTDPHTGETQCWPSTILPQKLGVRARVMNYDYKNVYRSIVFLQTRFYDSRHFPLIDSLAIRRASVGDRPIVFVAHGLGGLLVKRGLVYAMTSGHEKLRKVYDDTFGIVFLGTPHCGAPTEIRHQIEDILEERLNN